ncbi:MAG: ABC transporter ATP-binding protein [Dehalococcoidia bacterium]
MYLEVKDLNVFFDTAQVLNKINIHVDKGEMVSLVGPNGAGKSTLLRTIAGLVKWEKEAFKGTKSGRITIEGMVTFDGERMDNLPPYEIAKRGLIICPERGRPFREMSIIDNLTIAAYLVNDNKQVKQSLDVVYQLFPILKSRAKQIAGTVSGGERTMLAIGRALMSQAKCLLVDEPSTGLSPKFRNELFDRLARIHGMGLTILLVEQDVGYAFKITNRNYVITKGHIMAEGTAKQLLADEFLKKTYLGL